MKTIIKIYWATLLVAGILISSTTNAQNCGVPGGLNVTVVSATSMQLNWNAVPGAIRYDLEIQNATNPVPFFEAKCYHQYVYVKWNHYCHQL
ncbi:MAG: hypothetical protein IPP46_09680 [Bacteroidetes bacterium]|nr:hypothetical protein [Bacteroidota bacterium]